MISLKINKALVTPLAAEALIKVCPFSAITYEDETLDIGAGCRMCKLCVKKGPEGVVSLVETHLLINRFGTAFAFTRKPRKELSTPSHSNSSAKPANSRQ